MRAFLSLAVSAFVCTSIAGAQSFNVDIGTANPAPSNGFGAAAAQPGTWNNIAASSTPNPLLDLSGAASAVTLTRTVGTGTNFSSNNAGTSGDDELLMDDAEFPSTTQPSTWSFSGLAAGTYTVTTYAWAPDNAAYFSGVSVNGGPVTPVGGAWPSGYTLGVTHAVDTVTISAGGTIDVTISTATTFATFNGVQITKMGPSFTPYCFGDGSGTACPCGNAGAAGNGCASSVNASGANLAASGNASVGSDTFVLTGSGMPDSSALYFQGTTQLNITFGDGLRCVGGTIVRLGTKTNSGGTSSYPSGADVVVSVKAGLSAGDVRNYQVWYRNAANFCTSATFNLTNGVQATWTP